MVINRSVSVAFRIQPTPAETHTFNSAAWEYQLELWISGKKRVFDNLWQYDMVCGCIAQLSCTNTFKCVW
jgi:hypothetical protein